MWRPRHSPGHKVNDCAGRGSFIVDAEAGRTRCLQSVQNKPGIAQIIFHEPKLPQHITHPFLRPRLGRSPALIEASNRWCFSPHGWLSPKSLPPLIKLCSRLIVPNGTASRLGLLEKTTEVRCRLATLRPLFRGERARLAGIPNGTVT